jgi:FhuF 2Fe-2S C-terminal domain
MPFADTYHRLVRLCGALRVTILDSGHPAGSLGGSGTWLSAAELADRPEAAACAVEGERRRILADHGRGAPPYVAASRLLHDHLWAAALLMSGPWYLTGQVAGLPPDRLWIDPADGSLALLPEEPETGAPADRASPDSLRAAVAEYAAPLLEAFRPLTRRGTRALWGMVADDLVSGVWYLGRALGEETRAMRVADTLVPDGAGFRTLRGVSGRTYPTRTRAGCCLYYAIRPDATCLTCPRLADGERLRRLEEEQPQEPVAAASG